MTNYNPAELIDNAQRPVRPNDKVKLTKYHPQGGRTGTYEGCVRKANLWGAEVSFVDGSTCMVWRNVDWQRVGGDE